MQRLFTWRARSERYLYGPVIFIPAHVPPLHVFAISIADGRRHVNRAKPNDYRSTIYYVSTGMFIVLYPCHRDYYSRGVVGGSFFRRLNIFSQDGHYWHGKCRSISTRRWWTRCAFYIPHEKELKAARRRNKSPFPYFRFYFKPT